MPDVPVSVGGVVMLMPFEAGQVIKCDGPDHHVVGTVGERRINRSAVMEPRFEFAQPHDRSAPIFDHHCTDCGSHVTFPRARARSF